MSNGNRAVIPAELQGLRPAGAYTFDELYRLAQVCHASGLFEDVTDAAQAMVKIVKGQELGLPPTTAMSGFDLIRKRLFIKPWVLAAKINTCGYGSYRVLEQTPERCIIRFVRKYPGEGWVPCEPVSYTLAEAKAHGLVDRSPHWKASPAHMLYQRCMGRGAAMHFPELLAGLSMPQDDTPISVAQRQDNIAALFADDADPAAFQEGPQDRPQPTQSTWVVSEEGVTPAPVYERTSGQPVKAPPASTPPAPDADPATTQAVRTAIEEAQIAQGLTSQQRMWWRGKQVRAFRARSFAHLPLVVLEGLLADLHGEGASQDAPETSQAPVDVPIEAPVADPSWRVHLHEQGLGLRALLDENVSEDLRHRVLALTAQADGLAADPDATEAQGWDLSAALGALSAEVAHELDLPF